MSYTTRAKIEADIPADFLLQALDDNSDGVEDAGLFDQILTNASEEVDSYLEGRYTLPINPAPNLLKLAAKTFVLETLYNRRGYSADTDPANPWSTAAENYRKRLKLIMEGEEALQVNTEQADASVEAITEPAKTHTGGNRLSA